MPDDRERRPARRVIAALLPKLVINSGLHKQVWESDKGRILIIADCQIIQKLAMGHAALDNDRTRDVFVRTTNRLWHLVEAG